MNYREQILEIKDEVRKLLEELNKALRSKEDEMWNLVAKCFTDSNSNAFFFYPESDVTTDGLQNGYVSYPSYRDECGDELGYCVGVISKEGKYHYIKIEEDSRIQNELRDVNEGRLPVGFQRVSQEWLDERALEIDDLRGYDLKEPSVALLAAICEAPNNIFDFGIQGELFEEIQ